MRLFAAVAAGMLATSLAAAAQTYPLDGPAPRTTNPAALRAIVESREVHERFARGTAAEARGDWRAAALEFERIAALRPREPQGSTALYDLALARAHLGELDAAAKLLESALQHDPGFVAAAANLVNVQLLRSDAAAAKAAAERLVAIAPRSARAMYLRGLVALRMSDAAAARSAFGALADSDPTYAVAHYDLALAELHDGRESAAERELERALALAPNYARARFALATLHLKNGRFAAARNEFERCARDTNDAALRNLALSLRDRANPGS